MTGEFLAPVESCAKVRKREPHKECPIHGYQGLLPSSSCPLAHYRNGRIETCGQPLIDLSLTGASEVPE